MFPQGQSDLLTAVFISPCCKTLCQFDSRVFHNILIGLTELGRAKYLVSQMYSKVFPAPYFLSYHSVLNIVWYWAALIGSLVLLKGTWPHVFCKIAINNDYSSRVNRTYKHYITTVNIRKTVVHVKIYLSIYWNVFLCFTICPFRHGIFTFNQALN